MNKKDIKIVFMGTSIFAVPTFLRMIENYDVKLAICTPDKPAGRHLEIKSPPIKRAALENNIPVYQPERVIGNSELIQKLNNIDPDLIVVVAYGKILPAEVLNLPKHGCLNIHFSLLPKYRGPSPMQSVLLNSEKETGVTVILLDSGMDTGDIVAQEHLEILSSDDFSSLSHKLSVLAAETLDRVIPHYINGEINLEIQDDDEASYCFKINEDLSRIQWSLSAKAIADRIRAISFRVGCYTKYNDKRLYITKGKYHKTSDPRVNELEPGTVYHCFKDFKVICVKCGKGALELHKVKLEGKNEMPVQEFVNGHQNFVGTKLK